MTSITELNAAKEAAIAQMTKTADGRDITRVVVGLATCGIAAGSVPVLKAFEEAVAEAGLDTVRVIQAGCIGMCQYEPMVEVVVPGRENVAYVNMTPDKAIRVVHEHIIGGKVVSEYTVGAVIN